MLELVDAGRCTCGRGGAWDVELDAPVDESRRDWMKSDCDSTRDSLSEWIEDECQSSDGDPMCELGMGCGLAE